MDDAAAAAIKEDGFEKRPHSEDRASENNVCSSAEDTADVNHRSLSCEDCGLKFTHLEVFKTHLHQHALEEEEEEEEEEEVAQMGDNRNHAAVLDSGRGGDGENRDEDMDDDADGCDMISSSQTKPSDSIQGVGVSSSEKIMRKGYACMVCGKVYIYHVSFRKHQLLHENNEKQSSSVQNLHKYDCPECGMSFIRRARLLGHLRVHRSHELVKPEHLRCDQCNKDFTSAKSWAAHVDLHKQKPFWCLSCAKGFTDEGSLDAHLQSHRRRQHKCNICHKCFHMPAELKNHYTNSHTGAKPYQCTFCGMSFAYPGYLIAHRKKHLRAYVRSGGMALGFVNSAFIAKKRVIKKKRPILTSVTEEPEMDTNMDGNEELMERSEIQKPCEDAEYGDRANSEDSDCGEPVHHVKPSKPPAQAGPDPPDEAKSDTVEQQAGQELDESESQETRMHWEHKYWEWECCECDMGFDEVEKLHLHYIKHATGELPLPQDDSED